jgi:hypothetical protein
MKRTPTSQPQSSFVDMLTSPELKIAFMRPVYLASSAWLEHLPFAFWLVHQHRPATLVELGTHYGCSYFAFCQAVEKLSLNARCYAVDTWKGDEHAGFYDEEVFSAVTLHNKQLYSRFSTLIRATFDASSEYFADQSIDLLHIDGLHTFSAVQHDFETWKPKLSDRAVVILHDTNVRERGFGVGCMMDILRKDYPFFEFDHGHGLGIVGVGETQSPGMRMLFEASVRDDDRQGLTEFFSRLGGACADAYLIRKLQASTRLLRDSGSVPPSEVKNGSEQ